MTDRALLQQALEALDYVMRHGPAVQKAKDLLRTALEQPEQEPLTDEQLKPLIQKAMMYYGHNPDHWLQTSGAGFCILARAIEAAHGIKGDA